MKHGIEDRFAAYARHGDLTALAEVFDAVAPELARVARHLVHGGRLRQEVEDLVQATFLTALEKAARYDPARPLVPWLVGILALHAKEMRRTAPRVRAEGVEGGEEATTPESADPLRIVAGREGHAAVGDAVRRLPAVYARVLEAVLMEDRRPEEVAAELALTPGTARVRLHRGLAKLRRLLPKGYALGWGAGGWNLSGGALAEVRTRVLIAAGEKPGRGTLAAWPGSLVAVVGLVCLVVLVTRALFAVGGGASETETDPRLVAAPSLVAAANPKEDDPVLLAEVRSRSPRVEDPDASLSPSTTRRLTGRIAIPYGAPRDDTLRVELYDAPRGFGMVTAIAAPTQDSNPEARVARWHAERPLLLASSRVDEQGAFALDVPSRERRAYFVVNGRYLRLPQPLAVDLVEEPEPCELRPHLGAWVHGRLIAPKSMKDADLLADRLVEMQFDSIGPVRSDLILTMKWGEEHIAVTDDEGHFEWRGLSPASTLWIAARAPGCAPTIRRGLDPRPGREIEVELPLVEGATLRGRVLFDDHFPCSDAVVTLEREYPPDHSGPFLGVLDPRVRTDAEGRFELSGVAPGEWALSVGSRAGEVVLPMGRSVGAGDLVEGLEAVVPALPALAGRVLLADGRIAPGAVVLAQLATRFHNVYADGIPTVVDEEGRFVIRGLEVKDAIPYVVTATQVSSAGDVIARAVHDGVAPGTTNLELLLLPTHALEGNVTAADDSPLRRYWVQAVPLGDEGEAAARSSHGRTFSTHPFTLFGLETGRWAIYAGAEGFARVMSEVTLPSAPSTAPLHLVLERESSNGIVVTPEGHPVAGAVVQAWEENGEPNLLFDSSASPSPRTDAHGRFRGEGLKYIAGAAGYAPSAPVTVPASDDASLAKLVLRPGGSLVVEAFTKEGEEAHGYLVRMSHRKEDLFRATGTGDTGRCEVRDLLPGRWWLQAEPVSYGAPVDRSLAMSARVDIRAGEEARVVLGTDPRRAVTVRGRVASGTEPMVAMLVFAGAEAALLTASDRVVTDAEGRYEVELTPGQYVALVLRPDGKGILATRALRVAAGPDPTIDFALPSAAIEGVVLDEAGNPVPGVEVWAIREDGVAPGWGGLPLLFAAATSEDGRFRIPFLAPGPYSVAAGKGREEGFVGGVVASADPSRDVEIRCAALGELAVRVVDPEGKDRERRVVVARDATGRTHWPRGGARRGANGEALLTLPPGTYTVRAMSEGLASAESSPVLVLAGGTAAVEVQLAPGSLLEIDPGDLLVTRLRILDDQDYAVHGIADLSTEHATQRPAPTLFVAGPLLPGRYAIEADLFDGSRHREEVWLPRSGPHRATLGR